MSLPVTWDSSATLVPLPTVSRVKVYTSQVEFAAVSAAAKPV